MNVVTEISKASRETHLQGTWAWQGHGKGMRNGPRAPAHQQHAVSQEHRFSNIVGDKYHRVLAMLPHLEQLQIQLFAGNGIERAKRFIHKQYRGLEQERTRQGDTLLHTPRELVGTMASEVTQAQQGEQLESPLPGLGACLPRKFYRQQDIVEHGTPGEQYRTLKDKTHLAPG